MLSAQKNPSDNFVKGSGTTDVALDATATEYPMVNDPNTYILVKVRNNGQTTIEKLNLTVRLNSVVVENTVENYELKPGEFYELAIPINYYWSLSGVTKDPGQYAIEATAGFNDAVQDSKPADNTSSASAPFVVNITPVLKN